MCASPRFFHCARCHIPVTVCRRCDRGQIYCGEECAGAARARGRSRAAQKYRASRKGRLNNAERQRRFRERQRKKVTHHGSDAFVCRAVLTPEPEPVMSFRIAMSRQTSAFGICHFCGQPCGEFVRRNYLRSFRRPRRSGSPRFPDH